MIRKDYEELPGVTRVAPGIMNRVRVRKSFVLCIENRECDDLGKGKVYALLTDARGKRDGYVRVIDESAEDYLYPAFNFVREEDSSQGSRGFGRRGQLRTRLNNSMILIRKVAIWR